MIKPPKIQTIPDILNPVEIEQILGKTRKLRYRVFLLTAYSMGLRLAEALSLKSVILMGSQNRFISAMEKAIKIDWFPYLISHYRHYVNSGAGIGIRCSYFPMPTDLIEQFNGQRLTWTKGGHKRP